MTKKYVNNALVYAIIAMIFGVFYREFTKFFQFTGKTTLSVMHTHYFMLGMFFFLIMALLENSFHFSSKGKTKTVMLFYNIGLNVAGAMLFVRGFIQVLYTEIARGLDASISGIAGIGHIMLGVSIIIILLNVKKSIAE